jgi:endonuclease V-like protein UPF0215 family
MKSKNLPKGEIRVMGIDDAPFDKFKDRYATVIGTMFRGGSYADGITSTRVRVDGINATKKIAEMINSSRFRSQLRCVFIDGLNMAGFNFIDIRKLNRLIRIPVIVITRKDPDLQNIKRILKKLKMERKIKFIDEAGPPKKVGKIYVQIAGIDLEKAKGFIKLTATRSYIPEPLRLAHLIGAGLVKGESRGNA